MPLPLEGKDNDNEGNLTQAYSGVADCAAAVRRERVESGTPMIPSRSSAPIVLTDLFRATLSLIRDQPLFFRDEMSRLTMPYNALQCSSGWSEHLCDLPPTSKLGGTKFCLNNV